MPKQIKNETDFSSECFLLWSDLIFDYFFNVKSLKYQKYVQFYCRKKDPQNGFLNVISRKIRCNIKKTSKPPFLYYGIYSVKQRFTYETGCTILVTFLKSTQCQDIKDLIAFEMFFLMYIIIQINKNSVNLEVFKSNKLIKL